MKNSRREFIKAASATVAGTVINPNIYASTVISKAKPNPVCAFTKCLQFLDYDRLGEILAHVGFNGADLTVRKSGHVEPEKVKEDLLREEFGSKKPTMSIKKISNYMRNDLNWLENKFSEYGILG